MQWEHKKIDRLWNNNYGALCEHFTRMVCLGFSAGKVINDVPVSPDRPFLSLGCLPPMVTIYETSTGPQRPAQTAQAVPYPYPKINRHVLA